MPGPLPERLLFDLLLPILNSPAVAAAEPLYREEVCFLKMYLVHLDTLPMQARMDACQKISQLAWDTYEQIVPVHGLVAVKVAWDRKEDFMSSTCYPAGCRCELLGG